MRYMDEVEYEGRMAEAAEDLRELLHERGMDEDCDLCLETGGHSMEEL